MRVEIVGRMASDLPADDDHPYRTGPWRPNHVEYDATDLAVVGDLPADLDGVYPVSASPMATWRASPLVRARSKSRSWLRTPSCPAS
jgi:carotenoid cleavage dioxygenase-like enzyme